MTCTYLAISFGFHKHVGHLFRANDLHAYREHHTVGIAPNFVRVTPDLVEKPGYKLRRAESVITVGQAPRSLKGLFSETANPDWRIWLLDRLRCEAYISYRVEGSAVGRFFLRPAAA